MASAAAAKAKKLHVVHISVVSLIPGSTQAAFNEFNNQVAEFEAANPGISVRGVQYQWLPATFAAKLASGTLPTVFTVPFTDGRSLGNNGQLANLTKYAEAEPYYKDFNPAVIAEGIDSKKQVIAIPTAAYAQALSYNRQLFSEAGLNPNKPPTTWAQLEADAKQISQKTGKAGYAEMGASDNTAGWILTTLTDALGGRMETGIGAKAKATFDNPAAVQALNILKHDALERQLDGLQLRPQLGHHRTRRSPPARSACSSAAPTCTPTWCRPTTSIRRSTAWRRFRLPTARTPASSAAARSPRSARSPARRRSRLR